jgi:membrane protease YdiL (CAAX protease family)
MNEIRTTTVEDAADRRTAPPPSPATGVHIPQLTRRGIIGVWAAATVPMGLLAWVVAPLVADRLSGPGALARALIAALAAGLVWQFVLVVLLVRREQGTLRWAVVREALWLRAPVSPRTGRRGGRLWLVVLPLIVLMFAEEFVPSLPHDPGRDFGAFVTSDAGTAVLAGSWGWFAVLVTVWVFNTVLGEELLFRGYLLPRMSGAFGRGDWLVNGVLFAGYHVHMWWGMPGILLDALTFALPSRYYRSALIGIAVHSAQSVFVCALVLPVVLGG